MPELSWPFSKEPFPREISELQSPNSTKIVEIICLSSAFHKFVWDLLLYFDNRAPWSRTSRPTYGFSASVKIMEGVIEMSGICAPNACFVFPICRSLSNRCASNATEVENPGQVLHFLTPVKLWECGRNDCVSFFCARPEAQYFCRCSLAVWKIRVWMAKKIQQ